MISMRVYATKVIGEIGADPHPVRVYNRANIRGYVCIYVAVYAFYIHVSVLRIFQVPMSGSSIQGAGASKED